MSAARQRWAQSGRVVASLVAFFVVWEIGARVFHTPEYILPAPSVIFAAMAASASHLAAATLFTVRPMLVGFALAVVVGVALALVVAFSPVMGATVYPLRSTWSSRRTCRPRRSTPTPTCRTERRRRERSR